MKSKLDIKHTLDISAKNNGGTMISFEFNNKAEAVHLYVKANSTYNPKERGPDHYFAIEQVLEHACAEAGSFVGALVKLNAREIFPAWGNVTNSEGKMFDFNEDAVNAFYEILEQNVFSALELPAEEKEDGHILAFIHDVNEAGALAGALDDINIDDAGIQVIGEPGGAELD
ncbi:hypothetical protein N9N97_02805 [Rickettsiaceae bacterium]|nr:hypothetical protein [Rickettsiaceae bacterium]